MATFVETDNLKALVDSGVASVGARYYHLMLHCILANRNLEIALLNFGECRTVVMVKA